MASIAGAQTPPRIAYGWYPQRVHPGTGVHFTFVTMSRGECELVSAPDGMTVGSRYVPFETTFAFDWQPTFAQLGTNKVIFRLVDVDNRDLASTNLIEIRVEPPPSLEVAYEGYGILRMTATNLIPEQTYRLETSQVVTNSSWFLLERLSAPTGSATIHVTNAAGACFYRLRPSYSECYGNPPYCP